MPTAQRVHVVADGLCPPLHLSIVAAAAEDEGRGVAQGLRIPAGVLARLAHPVELCSGGLHGVGERVVELVGEARSQCGCLAWTEAADDDGRPRLLNRLRQRR